MLRFAQHDDFWRFRLGRLVADAGEAGIGVEKATGWMPATRTKLCVLGPTSETIPRLHLLLNQEGLRTYSRKSTPAAISLRHSRSKIEPGHGREVVGCAQRSHQT
jgi:hypothetical protein